jgi:hypothetical protein
MVRAGRGILSRIKERVRHSGAYVISEIVGEGRGGYLFTRTYFGYTLAQAKTQFKIALEGEGK